MQEKPTNDPLDSSSDSDLDWGSKRIKSQKSQVNEEESSHSTSAVETENKISERKKKFSELREKADTLRAIGTRRLQIAEKRRTQRLLKKALKDPHIKELVEVEKGDHSKKLDEQKKEEDKQEWNGIKPYLNINSHLQGPVSHGDWGPKTELECIINDALNEGDIQKAEILSDTLANKEFAGKICKAYAAKRESEKLAEQKEIEKARQKKKIRWTFDAKERWQMKGNM